MNDRRTLTIAVTALLFLGLTVGALAGSAAAQPTLDASVSAANTENGTATTINVQINETSGTDATNVTGDLTVTDPDGNVVQTDTTNVGTLNNSGASYTVSGPANTVGTHDVSLSVTSDQGASASASTTYEVQPLGYNAALAGGDVFFHGDARNLSSATNYSLSEYQTTDGVDLVSNFVPWDLNDGESATFFPLGDDDLTQERLLLRPPTPQRIHMYDERGNRLSPGQSVTLGMNVTIALDYRDGFTAANHTLDFVAYEEDVDVTTELKEDITTTTMTGYDKAWVLQTEQTGTYDLGTQPGDFIFDQQGYDNQFDALRTLSIVDDDQPELELEVDSAYQGEYARYEIAPATEGDHFLLFIDQGDLRRPNNFAEHRRAFRLDDDAIERGVVGVDSNGNYVFMNGTVNDDNLANYNATAIEGIYAIVEREDSATSRIATEYLDDGDVDIELYAGPNEAAATTNSEVFHAFREGDDIDDRTLTVQQGQITINQPPTTYVPGTQVDINGTTTTGMDDVQVYIRGRDKYKFLTEIAVVDGQYEETSVVLNRIRAPGSAELAPGSDILALPGSYRFGVIDKEDVEGYLAEEHSGLSMGHIKNGSINLDSGAFNRGASTAQSIRVADPTLDASIETYNGEIYRNDGLYISGELVGPRDFVVLATDAQGNTMYHEGSADRRTHAIDETGVPLVSVSGENLRSGTVDAIIISPGRDQLYGDGVFTVSENLRTAIGWQSTSHTATNEALGEIVRGVDARQLTRTQVREILLADTVEEAGSDDLFVAESFRVSSDPRVEINSVVPTQLAGNLSGVYPIEHGETMVVRGTTNRNPAQTLMVVEATDGPDEGLAAFPSATTEEWGFDGVWSVEIPITEEVTTDTYTIEVGAGQGASDTVEVEIVGEGEAGDREPQNIEALQQQIQDLQDDIEALEGERNELQDRIAELEETNEQLRQDKQDLQQQLNNTTGGDTAQPGFTVVAALLSLIAVALLAMRRREE